MYFFLFSILHLHFVFSGALPFDKKGPSSSDGGGLLSTTWAEAVNEQGICKLAASFLNDCNSCICELGRPPACTEKACPPKHIDSFKRCKPGNRWKEECNKCICSEEGEAQCTIRDCLSRKRMKRYFSLDAERGKISHCTPGSSWKVDCNSCSCSEKGVPECTLKACIKWERIIDRQNLTQEIKDILDEDGKCKSLTVMMKIGCNACFCSGDGELYCTLRSCSRKENREKRATDGKIPPGGKCKPGEKWKLDECNNCVCTHTGFASCTLNECTSAKRPKRTPAETGKIPPGGKCKPGEKWKLDECNNCVCTHTGFASCTLNECTSAKRPKRSPAETGKIPPGGKCKPGEKWKLDECNNCVCTHTGFASCTLNECTSAKRPKRSPAETGKIPPGGKCKPGEKWKLDECNNCVCTHTGFASCTLNECTSAKRPKRSPAETGKIPAGGKCKPGDKWKLDECNNCVCTHTGFASCTLNECTSAKRPKRTPAETGKIPAGGKCKPGEKWKLDECNNCVCTHTGFASCTLNECTSAKRPKRSPAETGKIPPGGKCKPGEKWKLDECNNCVCTHTGFASCTLNECTSAKRPKRTTAETGKIPPGGKCKPGEKWKLDECNNCVCTHTGFASCTLNECTTAKRPKRTPAETGKVKPGGKCKPGEKWNLDECNKCVCTHTGYASCTLNDCSQKGRNKRSTHGSQLSDFVDEKGVCKEDSVFLWDCNTCHCRKAALPGCTYRACAENKNITQRIRRHTVSQSGLSDFVDEQGKCIQVANFSLDCNSCQCLEKGIHALCTRVECLENKNKTQRLARDARNENGNSGLECKPGVSWKENCNSCFCSERGIAMCTDIPTCPSPPPAPAKEISKPPTEEYSTKNTTGVSTSEAVTEQHSSIGLASTTEASNSTSGATESISTSTRVQ